MELKELLHSIVCSIVDDTEHVKIDEVLEDGNLGFHIAVAQGDVGKLIGTKGRIAMSIRTVLKAAGAKRGVRVFVNVDKAPLS